MAFHEKAGRSQVDSCLAWFNKFLFLPPSGPLSPCFHPHSRGANHSLGACWAFSVQPVLLSVWRPVVTLAEWNLGQAIVAVTGTRLWALSLFSSWNDFDFVLPGCSYAAAATVVRLLLCNGSYTSPLTHK